jgi:hypothetical protein
MDKIATDIPKELKYIQDRYMESFMFLQNRKRRQVKQLVLLNNLNRGDQNISSTLLLTLFNRTLSALYDDKLQIKFLPSQGINQEQLNSYNTLAQSDYLEMQKAKLDYDWDWDALFFGRGYMETLRFNKKRKIMEPHVINPLVFGYDPYFEEVQEWRYYWKWVTKSEVEIKRLIKNGTITGIKKPNEIASGVDEYLWSYKIERDKAKKAVEPSANSLSSDVYQILEFYGYNDDGDKCVYWLDKGFSKVLWTEKLDLQDLDYGDNTKEKGSKWPICVKEVYREPHSSVNFSIADLLEDKHRAKSVLLNLAFIAAKDRANPIYLYNPDKVTDITQFFSRQIDQHIPVNDVDKAVEIMNTQDPMSAGLIQFISMLTQEANDPVGTGQVAQPEAAKGDKTATSDAINQQLNDMAQSLQSKIMQFGESEFWSHWFHRYAKYGAELKDKMANIVGVKGITSEMIDMKDFNTDYPPGVLVYSAKEAEYKELVLRRDLMQLYPELQQTLDADGMRNFNKYVFFPKFLQDPSLIDIMLPKTIDELKAENENEQLVKDTMPQALPTDNHTTHIYTHNMIPPGKRTWAMWFHIAEHEKMLADQKAQEMQAQQMQMMQGQGQQTGSPNGSPSGQSPPNSIKIGTQMKSPIAAASPLKTAINNQPQSTTK